MARHCRVCSSEQSEDAKTASIFCLVGQEVPAPNLARPLSPLPLCRRNASSRFMRRCLLLTLIPSSLRSRATRFALTSNPFRRISAVMRRYPQRGCFVLSSRHFLAEAPALQAGSSVAIVTRSREPQRPTGRCHFSQAFFHTHLHSPSSCRRAWHDPVDETLHN
jgi:hypothetical protein